MPTADCMLSLYRDNLGLGEDPAGSNHNWITEEFGFDGAWCDMTFSVLGRHCKLVDNLMPNFAFVPYHMDWFAQNGRLGNAPIVGAACMFQWSGGPVTYPDHITIVEAVNGSQVITLGGNEGPDGVLQRSYWDLNGPYGMIFGYPPYQNDAPPPPPPSVGDGKRHAPDHDILFGAHSLAVIQLQNALNFVSGRGLEEDGDYGWATCGAVLDLHRFFGLPMPPDGRYNAYTHFILACCIRAKQGSY